MLNRKQSLIALALAALFMVALIIVVAGYMEDASRQACFDTGYQMENCERFRQAQEAP